MTFRTNCFGDEEGGNTVTGVAAHESAGIDHALIRGTRQVSYQPQIGRGWEAFRELRGAFEVGKQHRGGPPPR
jgi:hypothetical protein